MEINGKTRSVLFGGMDRHDSVYCCRKHGGWTGPWWFDPDTGEAIGNPVCPECKKEDEDRIRKENAIAVTNYLIEETLLDIGVPELSKTCRLENYVASTDVQREKAETIRRFVEDMYPTTLVFYGLTGSGKTHLAVSALAMMIRKAIAEKKSEGNIRYVKASELFRDFKSAMNSKRGGLTENQVMYQYENYKMLVIDELGRFMAGDYNVMILQEILTYRIENDFKTIIIKNGDIKSVVDLLGEHNVSRLKECGKSVRFDEPDWRTTHRRTNNDC